MSVDNTHTLPGHLPDRIEEDVSLEEDNSANGSGSKANVATKTSGHLGRETADSGGQTEHTATHQGDCLIPMDERTCIPLQ